ncbi:MAG: type II toxin-antitoxin system HicB family antitoxin [Pseudomonadota bacterium]
MKPYKGYAASIWFEADDRAFHGMVEGLRDVIHFTGASVDDLEAAFHASVDDYLAMCAEDGAAPEKPFSGKLAFRTSPEVHRKIAEAAAAEALSINQWMDRALRRSAEDALAEGRTRVKVG